ncbi:hypothetical protein H6504_05380 [Candidatus Woesearchaeota archaeon]|nr:hypothetical protein [Candidatus Woesearchaeota archaeon]
MEFPPESVQKAKEIADQYRLRSPKAYNRALRLFDKQFLHLNYGFTDAIKAGRGGSFLHEAKLDADCFSLAGMLYLIARETGLQPQLYSASAMYDVKLGESELECAPGDHSFITVRAEGKEILVDPDYDIMGVVTHQNGCMMIKKKDGRAEVTRKYSSLEQLTESDYVKQMMHHRSAEGGKDVLASGQKVKSRGHLVMIEYDAERKGMWTNYVRRVHNYIHEPLPFNYMVNALEIPLAEGRLDLDNSMNRFYIAETDGWKLEQHGGHFNEVTMPSAWVRQYIEHLGVAARYHNRRSSLHHFSTKDVFTFFRNFGFDDCGRIIKENGVDQQTHIALLENIHGTFPLDKERDLPIVNYFAAKRAMQELTKSSENPEGLLYTQTERDAITEEYLGMVRQNFMAFIDAHMDETMAKAGFVQGAKAKSRKVEHMINRKDVEDRFMDIINYHKTDPHTYELHIDNVLFQREHPLGTVFATDEEIMSYYARNVHMNMIHLIKLQRSLEIPDYRKGIGRILGA